MLNKFLKLCTVSITLHLWCFAMAHFSEVKIPKRNEDALIIDNDLNSSEEKQKVLRKLVKANGYRRTSKSQDRANVWGPQRGSRGLECRDAEWSPDLRFLERATFVLGAGNWEIVGSL